MFIQLSVMTLICQVLCNQLESEKLSQDLHELFLDAKVIGGEKAPLDYPYQLSLQMPSTAFNIIPRNFSHFCGAAILSENYFLTAAHCMQNRNLSLISVLAGTSHLRDDTNGYRHPVDSCLIHPDFIPLNTSDIALCKVKIPFVFGESVGQIALDRSYVGSGVNCTLTGWGSISVIRWFPFPFYLNLAYPDDLRRAFLPTINNTDCKFKDVAVSDKEICTFARVGKGACAGDSGGPLVSDGKLVGLVSYGTTVCALGMPDVFTRVSAFYDWIISNMVFATAISTANTVVNSAVQSAIASLPSIFQ